MLNVSGWRMFKSEQKATNISPARSQNPNLIDVFKTSRKRTAKRTTEPVELVELVELFFLGFCLMTSLWCCNILHLFLVFLNLRSSSIIFYHLLIRFPVSVGLIWGTWHLYEFFMICLCLWQSHQSHQSHQSPTSESPHVAMRVLFKGWNLTELKQTVQNFSGTTQWDSGNGTTQCLCLCFFHACTSFFQVVQSCSKLFKVVQSLLTVLQDVRFHAISCDFMQFRGQMMSDVSNDVNCPSGWTLRYRAFLS